MVFAVLYIIFILLFWGVFFIHIFRWCVFFWLYVNHHGGFGPLLSILGSFHSFSLSVHKHPFNSIKNKFEVCSHVTIYRILISYLLIISYNYNPWCTWRLWIFFPLFLINSLVTCMMSLNSVLLAWEFLWNQVNVVFSWKDSFASSQELERDHVTFIQGTVYIICNLCRQDL